jgi:hypothetical protein
MKFVKWVEKDNASWLWKSGSDIFATVDYVGCKWRAHWESPARGLAEKYDCAEDAFLAVEKWWPPSDVWVQAWFESKRGGYFRKFGRTVIYVRQTGRGWYAVRNDGRLLGKTRCVSWFATASEACNAVDKEWITPVDRDPITTTNDCWSWIKLAKQDGKGQAS